MFLMKLTKQRQHHWVIIGHDKQVDTCESCAGLQIAKWLPEFPIFSTITHKNLENKKLQQLTFSHRRSYSSLRVLSH